MCIHRILIFFILLQYDTDHILESLLHFGVSPQFPRTEADRVPSSVPGPRSIGIGGQPSVVPALKIAFPAPPDSKSGSEL